MKNNRSKKLVLFSFLGILGVVGLSIILIVNRNQRLIPYSYDSDETSVNQTLFGSWNYSAQAKGADVQAQFGKDKENARLRVSRENTSIEFHLPLSNSQLTANKDSLSFTNNEKSQELHYQILPNGVKEEIILHQKPVSNIVTSQLILKNLSGQVDSKSPRFYDSKNKYQFHFVPPYVEDAKGDRTYQVSYAFMPVDNTNNNQANPNKVEIATQLMSNKLYVLALIIDPQWLESSDRQYPLTIDPTVIHEDTPTVDVATHDNMRVGTQTPSIRFSATDPGSGDLVYEVEWATNSSMTSSTSVASDSGSGFSNLDTPADTSPFNSGDAIQFTFPSLSNSTTYYYRIRSKVSGGSYDAWSSVRSMTINTAQADNTWFQTHADQFSSNTNGADIRIDTGNNLAYTRDTNVYTPIEVTNSGGTQSDYDLLLNLDTATLIGQGRVQADCDDLRFYDDEYFSTSYNYWIESGCNTNNTQIWVRIPSLTSGTSTVYTGYLNPAASAGSQSWAGSVIIPTTSSSCAGSGTRVSAMDGYYVRGATSYGGTGGSSNHRHTISGTTGYTLPRGGEGVWGGCSHRHRGDHTHSFSFNSSYTDTVPPYIDTVFCRYNSFPQLQTTDIVLAGTTPSGWTRDSSFDTKLMRGASTYGGTGGGSHYHTYSGNLNSAEGGLESSNCGGNTIKGGTHNHAVYTSGTSNHTSTVTAYPPYRDQIVVKPNSNNVSVPQGGILPFNTATLPPYGWTQHTNLNDVFPRGNSTAGGTGGSSNHTHTFALKVNGTPSFSHSSSDIYTYITGATLGVGTNDPSSSHSKNGTSGNGSSLPPYINVVFGKKKSDSTLKSYLTEVSTITDTTTSTAIDINNLAANPNWKEVIYNSVESYGDLKIRVAFDSGSSIVLIPDEDLAGNSAGFESSPIDLSGLSSTTYPIIYLQATITSDGLNDESSQLLDWEVTTASNPTPSSDLLVEGQVNPTITTLTPYFSAIYEDFEVSDQASNYQIQVSSDWQFSSPNWDTGKTTLLPVVDQGDRTGNITYGGESLSQGTRYYWRIRFWDSHDLAGDWSDTGDYFDVMDLQGPTNCVGVYNGTSGEVNLSWVDQDTEEENFVIEKLTEPGTFGALITLNADSTSHDDDTVTTNEVYQYRIKTVIDSINSPWCTTSRISSNIGTFLID